MIVGCRADHSRRCARRQHRRWRIRLPCQPATDCGRDAPVLSFRRGVSHASRLRTAAAIPPALAPAPRLVTVRLKPDTTTIRAEGDEARGDGRRPAMKKSAKRSRDLLRGRGAVRAEPARDPVHGAEQREREQLRIAARERRRSPSPPRAPAGRRGRTRRGARSPPSGAPASAPRDRGTAPCRAARRESCGRRRRSGAAASRPAAGRSARCRRAAAVSRSSEYWWQAKRISSLFLK